MKSKQAAQYTPDPYGFLGLLSVIRMNDLDLASLALGIDLTILGLNLNSSENLHGQKNQLRGIQNLMCHNVIILNNHLL
jgi:hypothetical protein